MLKPQIIITAVAVALCALLAFAPKYVVENNSDEALSSPSITSAGSNAEGSHTEITENLEQRLSVLKNKLNESDNEETGLITLDTLIQEYRGINAFDSAAFFSVTFADKFPSSDNYLRAGNLYYEAFTFAVTEERTSFLADKLRAQYELAEQFGQLPEDAKVKLGMTYVSGENPMKGITMIREVLRENPENTTAIFNLGLLSMQSGQFDKAVERFERLKELQPNNLQAKFYLGISYLESGNKELARKELLELKEIETDPNVLETVDNYLSRTE